VKTLYLLRHAKSSWEDRDLDDRERPLAPRGERAATAMGVYLEQSGVKPALVLCSPARRCVETLERVRPHLPPGVAVRSEPPLYLASTDSLLARIREMDDDLPAILVVGHDPTHHDLACRLAGAGDPAARAQLERKFPTGALAELRFDVARWHEVDAGKGELRRFVVPKDLV